MAKTKLTDEQLELRENMKQHYFQESLQEPVPWLKLDTKLPSDTDLQELRDANGMAYLGHWLLLVCNLGDRPSHCYNTQTLRGWQRLASEIEIYDVEECKKFVNELYKYDLINRESFDEHQIITNRRVSKNVEEYAKSAAKGKFAAWCRNPNK